MFNFFIMTLSLACVVGQAAQVTRSGIIIVDKREKVGGNTQIYKSWEEFCGAPYTGHGLYVHEEGRAGVPAVMKLKEGQHFCSANYVDHDFTIAITNLGTCVKTKTEELNNLCGHNSYPDTAVEVTCKSDQFQLSETRYRQMVNGFWMRGSKKSTSAPNAPDYSHEWLESDGTEPGPAEAGAAHIGVESEYKKLHDLSLPGLQDVVFQMRALVYKNPPTKVGEPISPIELSNGMIRCEYKCTLSEAGECAYATVKPWF